MTFYGTCVVQLSSRFNGFREQPSRLLVTRFLGGWEQGSGAMLFRVQSYGKVDLDCVYVHKYFEIR
jgi:hypothetical protein